MYPLEIRIVVDIFEALLVWVVQQRKLAELRLNLSEGSGMGQTKIVVVVWEVRLGRLHGNRWCNIY